MGKTQHEVENEYYFVDLPELLLLEERRHATEMIEQLEAESYPHIMDKEVRTDILQRYVRRLPKAPVPKQLTAEEQYQAQLARMKGGG
ncbi:hypothetical protein [Paenibacillus tianjinensis]|uniref:Uncharacterized protein n=1 Tax=Paenibacillus tianjinensis TaxID=2810347 RepID=A0ABX7L5Y2_9BACL|nr:hypothetical protein [Paenibacillus tianjinensis]QSF42656.1 hypothetical protein JRJ22_15165 [Paenibacillus tianjinensis]